MTIHALYIIVLQGPLLFLLTRISQSQLKIQSKYPSTLIWFDPKSSHCHEIYTRKETSIGLSTVAHHNPGGMWITHKGGVLTLDGRTIHWKFSPIQVGENHLYGRFRKDTWDRPHARRMVDKKIVKKKKCPPSILYIVCRAFVKPRRDSYKLTLISVQLNNQIVTNIIFIYYI